MKRTEITSSPTRKRTTAAVRPLQSNGKPVINGTTTGVGVVQPRPQRTCVQNGVSTNISSKSPTHKPVSPKHQPGRSPATNITKTRIDVVSSRKICNEDMKPEPIPPQDAADFDFTAHMKTIRPSFNRFGQHEPATVRIKNIITQYVGDRDGCGVEELVKELMQNSDDAQATEIHFILDKRRLPTKRVWEEWKSMQGPALCVQNNSVFSERDIESIQKLGVGSKSTDPDKTGQFGIGFNVVYQLTDCPILLSDHKDICMFDPHLRYVPGACDERPGGHVDLRQDANFAKVFPDFMAGFLRGQVDHSGCTVFRFPLRQPDVKSQICDMTFAPPDVQAIEVVFQSVDFRMFLHSTLLFAKHLKQVKVSVIEDDGKIQEKVKVKRLIASDKQKQLSAALKRVSQEMRLLMTGQLKPANMTPSSISYHIQTEDEYLKNDWYINQTFGFHGQLPEEEKNFLATFYGEESKKFLPIAGVATKLNTSNMLVSNAYSFLPMPIQTGLPAHVNGHFAIHSSRRSIWEHTTFGHWNRILRDYVISPSYCHFLLDLGKTFQDAGDIKQWIRFLPEVSQARDDYFASLARRVFAYILEKDMSVIPVPQNDLVSFHSPSDCLFAVSPQNETVENLLLKLNQKVCTSPEVASRFRMADQEASLNLIHPAVVLERLKTIDMKLPKPVQRTAFSNVATVSKVLEFVLSGPASGDYTLLNEAPLSLSMDCILRKFSPESPVFSDSKFGKILPEFPQKFLHAGISQHFTALAAMEGSPFRSLNGSMTGSQKAAKEGSPIKSLTFLDVSSLLPEVKKYMDRKWAKEIWAMIKAKTSRSDVTELLAPISHLPVIPLSTGSIVSIDSASHIISTAQASKNMQMVIEALGMVRLDGTPLIGDELTIKDINQLATPFMLNAALPSAFIQALQHGKTTPKSIKLDHAEIILQYLNLDTNYIQSDEEAQETVKSLPIFEDVDGSYKALKGNHGVILDSCIPTHGVAQWMEKSNCLLLKEKAAYRELYEAVCLEKKNAIEVYLDDIFPNFSSFDDGLRMSHLTSIRTSLQPLLEAYADKDTQERFWDRLRSLPCIPLRSELLPVCKFRDPEVEVLTLLSNLHMLPLQFADEAWLEFLRKAGLKSDLTDEELLECAEAVTKLTTAQFSEEKAKLVIDTASSGKFHADTLTKLAQIKFIPQDSVPVDSVLMKSCPPVVPADQYIALDKALVYENDKDRHIFRHCVLCWSTQSTLPKWVQLSKELSEIANIQQQPTVTHVCQHMKNLCEKLPEKPSLSAFKSFRKVMYYCLDYLQNPCKCMKKRCENCAIIRSLKDTAFICVKNRHQRVKPTQVILHMPSDIDADVLYPYVFGRPADMAKYDDLLRHIGAVQTPGPDLYAEILHSLWLDFGSNDPLQTNDKQTASLAVYGLFTTLTQQGQRLTTRPLCLPSDKAMMCLSTELVISDSETLVKNIKDRGYQYMCSLSSCNLSKPAKELIFYLPDPVRPKLLTQLISERVAVDTPCEQDLDCPFYSEYYTRLHSEKFRQALWLIARVPEESRSQFSNELGRLKLLELSCIHVLYGYLSENGRTIEDTRVEKIAHVENTLASARLYVKHSETYPGPADLVSEVASCIKSVICYNENYYLDTGAIVELLKCASDEDIDQYLIEQGLNSKEDDMSRPKPGTLISKEARDVFLYDPDIIFQPKEYVGYVMRTNEDMVYARVIRESEKTEGQELKSMLREYDLDTGRGYSVQACATDLFKESRRQNMDHNKQLVISDKKNKTGSNIKQGSAIIEEAKRTVTKLLEEVYSDPTLWRQREKIKRMLLLKWHPDKAGDSTLALEVFKYLKTEIDRVEAKHSLSDDEDEEEEEEVYEWEEVVENGKTTNNNVREEKPVQHPQVKGDIEGAQRWLRQAEADMKTAKRLLETNTGYEWVCHICCEVIRKVMVATILAKSVLTSELECTRFTNKLYESISRIHSHPEQLPVLLLEFNKLKVDESTTRQPGMHTKSSIPAEVFTTDICNNAIRITESITDLLTTFINAAPAKEQTTQNGDVAHNGTENGAATNGRKQQADDEGPPKSAPQRLSTKTSHYSPGRTTVKRGGRIGVTPSYSRR